MMRKSISLPYLALAFFLFFWINLPKTFSDRVRSLTIGLISPLIDQPVAESLPVEMANLRLENQNLRAQIDRVYEWLLFDSEIKEQIELFDSLVKDQNLLTQGPKRAFLQRRAAQLGNALQAQLFSMPAQVIYRDPSSWSSSVWVNVGEKDNEAIGQLIIAKNSPVLSNGALVGIVDYVGSSQARVRLITDSGLSPAVRAVRGGIQNRELFQHLHCLLPLLETREDLFASETEKIQWLAPLKKIQEKSELQWEDQYLAKGEIHGSSAPFWRSRRPILKGIGFNFDYADAEGAARDLLSIRGTPLLKEGDFLVTTGLDGVFPPGLRVGTVSRIDPLKKGAYAFNIEVRPAAANLNNLETVFILPALRD